MMRLSAGIRRRYPLSISLLAIGGAVALFLLLLVFGSASVRADNDPVISDPNISASGSPKVLIVHDQIDDPQLGQELAALLGHFSAQSTIVEQQYYEAGSLLGYDIVFYMGGSHREINQDFLNDITVTSKPVVWMGRGLDWLGNSQPLRNYGFDYARVDGSGTFASVTYKNTSLVKTNPVANITYITDDSRATVFAWMEGDGEQAPYVIRSGNFWYFADIPMVGTDINSVYSAVGATEDSAYLVLADLLHDITGQDHLSQHLALVRIEDIHPNTDIDRLNSVVDYLYHKQIPFGIGLVPVYKNPETGEEVHLSDRPDFVAAIKDAQAKGAIIVLHGYTHQRVGETVVDYEFWDRDTHAPPADETPETVRARIVAALNETAEAGIFPQIWETPHYAASDMAHGVIAEYFKVVWERSDAPFFPYPVLLPRTGQIDLPETLGYVNPSEGYPGQGHSAETLIEVASRQEVVRDGYAAFFFHPMVDGSELRKMIEGLQDEGFHFVSPAQVANLPYHPAKPASWFSNLMWQISDRMGSLIPSKALDAEVAIIISIFVILYYWGIFLLSRRPAPPVGPADPLMKYVIVIPCLNEEMVLARTLDHLMSLHEPYPLILVINDDSDDHTRDIALSYPRDRVMLIDHPHAIARQGKGRVLNYAFKCLLKSDLVSEVSSKKVVMGVLDADGRAEPGLIEAIAPYFADPGSAAVQVGVRISNADTNVLTKWQNFEFLTFARISQKAREHLGSVGLGGNGQFVRLSALESLGDTPWTDCLTEDLDLGLRLMLDGWSNHYCPDTFVSQQGVPKLRPLVRQRTRWFQGHLSCWRHIPAIFASSRIQTLARTDTIYYLLAPSLVFFFMPASIMFVIGSLYLLATGAASVLVSPLQYLPVILLWYLFSFGALPAVVWTFYREEKDIGPWRAFIWAHVFSFFYVIWFIAGCKAIWRLAHGQGSWVKTARMEDPA
jgi:cellulose synthase/poly-beta-1,6-N-acetylglucosamine synthase-like glycosyltransferase/uncharacterized protein YdaL